MSFFDKLHGNQYGEFDPFHKSCFWAQEEG